MKDTFLRRTAAVLAGFGLRNLFPQVQPLGGGETSIGFEYLFATEEPLPPEALPMLEEWIRERVRAALPVQIREMVPQSARALLEQHGLADLAGQIQEEEGLVQLVEIDGSYDLIGGPHLSNTKDLRAFEILEIAPIEPDLYAIQGVTAKSRQDLKEWKKRLVEYREKNHVAIGSELGLWSLDEEAFTWHERGLKVRRSIPQLFVDHLPVGARELITPPPYGEEEGAPLAYVGGHLREALVELERGSELPIRSYEVIPHSSLGEEVEALFTPFEGTTLLWNTFIDRARIVSEATTLLHSIRETFKILGFSIRPLICGRQKIFEEVLRRAEMTAEEGEGEAALQFQAHDELGRGWIAATLRLHSFEEEELCSLTLTVSIERNLALLLERSGGALPRSLIPEVLRFLPVEARFVKWAEEEKRRWAREGFPVGVDSRRTGLSDRVREAKQHRVPFIVVLGEREESTGTYSLRDEEGKVETLGRGELLERVKRELNIEL